MLQYITYFIPVISDNELEKLKFSTEQREKFHMLYNLKQLKKIIDYDFY